MTEDEQLAAFSDELQNLVARYADECDLSSAAVIGALTMQIRLIQDNCLRRWDDGEQL